MLTVLSCIVFEHDPLFLALAVIILTIGAVLTMRLFARVRRTQGNLKYMWLLLSGLIAGGTIWSTHFVAMIAYESPFILGYDLVLTALSLLVAIAGTTAGLLISSMTQRSYLIEVGGIVFGASIAAMHFMGIEALKVSGILTLSTSFVVTSVLLSCIFGMFATSRIARPVTRYCKYGAAVSFILAVASLHFVAMGGVEILPLRLDGSERDLISNQLMGIAVVFTMSVLMLSAMITYSIDTVNTEVADNRLNHIAHHDPLTGLPNRAALDRHLDGFINRVAMDNARVIVLNCNLSRFKEINEVLGHAGGDAVLRHVAKCLSEHLDPEEYVARISGDEFVVVGKPVYYRGYMLDLCKRVQKLVALPLAWQGEEIRVASSVGYATYPDHAATGPKLMEAASRAMHRAKANGGNAALCYDADKDEQTRERSALAMDLRNALKNGEFELYYQLQNDVTTREVTGTEVLLRWNHPARGMVPPFEFIPIAEETGQIKEIGAWIIRTACREAASWTNPVKVAINVAPVQLADNHFPDIVAHALRESGLRPERLELEITETGIIADTSHALQIIHQLKKLGVRIAMDDFGTGYSSLATLQAFPFDKIKIDREFVKDLGGNKQSEAIVRATIILGESLQIPVLAEGVETEGHLGFLASQGCNEVQGFLFGKPMPVRDIRRALMASTAIRKDEPETEPAQAPKITLVSQVA
ncbi:putative bifunctional diguanylate cyclase/phosphodiesterase [Roseibium sediminicola]|uniref:EAL domain-containing protein n=1 Tax=Roseibium sediminicola TaxID=2933272 RepID=A0ABT0GNA5_9HYPH|nr:EAL domain-containing protein [Roseibium sp. CAU 1639]MCK7610896.1 EAL domain-containing protein [Roseibium sp. CAU 1639]